MRIEEILLIEKIHLLPVEELKDVFALVEKKLENLQEPAKTRRLAGGALEHLGLHIKAEDIDEMRRESWANFPRDFPKDN